MLVTGSALGVAVFLGLVLLTAAAAQAEPDGSATTPPTTRPAPTSVVTYNIRNSGANDGANAWPTRRDAFVATLRSFEPDLIGLQEVLADQADFVRAAMPEYGFIGTGRDDGQRAGEFAPILFRTARYELLDSGQSWLSQTPDVVGSFGWDAACTRIVVWAKLRERATGRTLLVANTHWDHVGVVARRESARLIRAILDANGAGTEPVILTGDFNCTEEDDPYRVLMGDGEAALLDTYRDAHATPRDDEASYNGFTGETAGKRIDWILCSRGFEVIDATIDRRTIDGTRFASDHYAVTTRLATRPSSER